MTIVVPFTDKHVDGAYKLIKRIASLDTNLCVRPKEALNRAAAKGNGGVVAIDNGNVCGFTALYDTAKPDHVECGSISVAPEYRHKGVAFTMVLISLLDFYSRQENANRTVIADVYEANTPMLEMLEGLGFVRFNAPDWVVNARGLKESQEQSQMQTICLSINADAMPRLQSLYSDAPRYKAA